MASPRTHAASLASLALTAGALAFASPAVAAGEPCTKFAAVNGSDSAAGFSWLCRRSPVSLAPGGIRRHGARLFPQP